MTMQTGPTPELDPREAKIMVMDALALDLEARRAEKEHRYDSRFHQERDGLLDTLTQAGYTVPVDYLRQWDDAASLREELNKIGR